MNNYDTPDLVDRVEADIYYAERGTVPIAARLRAKQAIDAYARGDIHVAREYAMEAIALI